MKSITIKPEKWVEHITGTTETKFRKDPKKYISEKPSSYSAPELFITNKKTKEQFSCGSLELLSIKELRTYAAPSQKGAGFEIIIRDDNESVDQVNVAVMQTLKQYDGAVFLVASNFNGVESVSEKISPNASKFTTNYIYDPTQGPIASLGAPAAALQRTIFPFYNKETESTQWCQTETRQLEILQNMNDIYHVVNGYPCIVNGCREPTEIDKEKYISIIHSNVEVSYIFQRRYFECIEESRRNHIDQVFAAAVNIRQGENGYNNERAMRGKPNIGKLPLECGYEACYLTAIKNKRSTIVLTLLGGGVFGTPHQLIFESIINVHKQYGMQNNGTLQGVVMPFYQIGTSDDVIALASLLEKHQIPYHITHYQNNTIKE